MTVRSFLIGSVVTAIASWGVWSLIINWVDPIEAGFAGFTLFFLSLFLAVAGTVSLVGYILRRLLVPSQMAAYRVRPSLRQGVWLGVLLDILLFLQLQRLLRWWISLILVILFLSLEFFFLSYDKASTRHKQTAPDSQR